MTEQELMQAYKEGRVVISPFPRGEYAWHIYRISKTGSKKGWTKRLVSWEQMVAGLAKDPNGIYVKYRDEADHKIAELNLLDSLRGDTN